MGAILTQNTSWTNVERAIARLKKSKILSVKKMAKAPPELLLKCLKPAGYFNIKAKRIKNFLNFLYAEHGGSLEKLFAEPTADLRQKLLGVNGIGPETADSIILYAAKQPVFVVDAYTRRIASRIGLIHEETSSYDEIQQFFTKFLPSKESLFNEFHALLVVHAKRVCKTKPLCSQCPLRPLCVWGRADRGRDFYC